MLDFLRLSVHHLHLVVLVGVLLILKTTIKELYLVVLKHLQPMRFLLMNLSWAGKNTKWKLFAIKTTTVLLSVLLKILTQWAYILVIVLPLPLPLHLQIKNTKKCVMHPLLFFVKLVSIQADQTYSLQ